MNKDHIERLRKEFDSFFTAKSRALSDAEVVKKALETEKAMAK